MPWCDNCSHFYNPNSLSSEGKCPSCGTKLHVPRIERRDVAAAERRAASGDGQGGKEKGKDRGVPWHFWVLVVALVIYLGYRFYQGILWVAHKL